jgi:hypothetical protein
MGVYCIHVVNSICTVVQKTITHGIYRIMYRIIRIYIGLGACLIGPDTVY